MISEKSLILPNRQHRYELGNNPDFGVSIVISVHKGLKSLSYLSPKIWELLPLEIKETDSQNLSQLSLQIYLQNVGFI